MTFSLDDSIKPLKWLFCFNIFRRQAGYVHVLKNLHMKADYDIILRKTDIMGGKSTYVTYNQEGDIMKKVKTLNTNTLKESMKKGGCGECQTSCQSACKTSCTVGNQTCENSNR